MDTSVLKVSNVTKRIKKSSLYKMSILILNRRSIGFSRTRMALEKQQLKNDCRLGNTYFRKHRNLWVFHKKDYVKAMSNVGCIIEGPDLYGYMSGYRNLEILGSMSKG